MAKNSAANSRKSAIKLVVVESPTKARTIRKFLGKDYIVESCMGHVRDLPQSAKDIPEKFRKQKWATIGVDYDNGFEPIYLVPKNKTKTVKQLKDALAEADELILATDEDREGESISWHLIETLKPSVPYRRMVFNEITKSAILEALKETRDIDFNLVRAQEARRILDRLVGYTISPLLWKKVAYGLSAGRVQSVAVRLVCERETDRMRFKRAEYWSVEGAGELKGSEFPIRLIETGGSRVALGRDFDPETGRLKEDRAKDLILLNQAKAQQVLSAMKSSPGFVSLKVIEAEERPVSRKPAAPFITSTLQQEANRKLGLSAREAMQVAQSLYEQGFITYMRTDSTFLSAQAIDGARQQIKQLFGAKYLPDQPRTYDSKKVKGAQEAHEAIRPAGQEFAAPESTGLSGLPLRLYEMIWRRTLASQMANSQQRQMSVRMQGGQQVFSATGQTIDFDGFLRVYVESEDEDQKDGADKGKANEESKLPPLKVGDTVLTRSLEALSHETKPPARFTEASLVQRMEKEGIGRPSTYAAVISTIVDRGYVRRQGGALAPTFTAMVVTKLLTQYFPQYVDLGFTSEMEKSLDNIAEGELDHLKYLKTVYLGEKGLRKQVESQEKKIDPAEARSIELLGLKGLSFRVGKFGAYVCRTENGQEVCTSIPDAQAPADITEEAVHKLIEQKKNGADALGRHPKTGEPIYVLNGRFGPYVQLGEIGDEEAKPKRTSLPQGLAVEDVTLEVAVQLLDLPKVLGLHPGTSKEIKAGLGRFGPYVVCDGDYRSIPKTHSLFSVTLQDALDLLARPKQGRGRAAPIRDLGLPPGGSEPVQVFSGKFGPYVKLGKTNATIPEEIKPDAITMEQAIALIEARGGSVKAAAKPRQKGSGKKRAVESSQSKPHGKTGVQTAVAKSGVKARAGTAAKTVTRRAVDKATSKR